MRRGIGWIITIALCLSLMESGAGKSTDAAVIMDGRETVRKQLSVESCGKARTKATEKYSYREGKALVFYQAAFSGKKKLKTSLKKQMEEAVAVDEIWQFGSTDAGTQSAGSRTGLFQNVALVSSEQYSTEQLVASLKKQPGVIYAVPDYVCYGTTKDTFSTYQWALENTGQNQGVDGKDLGISRAWEDGNYQREIADSARQVVAVLDSGIDFSHEDLQEAVWNNPYQGVLMGEHGYDFVNGDTNPQDDNGHGTHVSGIIAAKRDNEKGITGVDDRVKIMALKFLDKDGYGSLEDVVAAYSYVYQAKKLGVNVTVINNSWAAQVDEETLDLFEILVNLLGQQGVLTVAAAGNESKDIDNACYLPAGLQSKYCISVAATGEDGTLASYSNYGKNTVDVAAPGTDILSAVNTPCFNPSIYSEEQQEQLCQYYSDFETTWWKNGKTCYQLQPLVYQNGTQQQLLLDQQTQIKVEAAEGFGEKDSRSMKISLMDGKAGDRVVVALPYQLDSGTKNASRTVFVSGMLQVNDETDYDEQGKENGDNLSEEIAQVALMETAVTSEGAVQLDDSTSGIAIEDSGNHWNHIFFPMESGVRAEQKRTLLLDITLNRDGNAMIYLDDLAVSIASDAAGQDRFGKYDFYNGTSMAAPYIVGSIALLKSIRPDYDMETLRDAVCSMYRQPMEGEEKNYGFGRIDFRWLDQYVPVLEGAHVQNGALKLNGRFFGTEPGNVVINGEEAAVITGGWSEQTIWILGEKWKDNMTVCQVVTNNGSVEKSFFVSGADKSFQPVTEEMSFYYEDGYLFSDGVNLYYLTETGVLYEYGQWDGGQKEWFLLSYLDEEDLFTPDSLMDAIEVKEMQVESEPVYLNGSIYLLVSYCSGYSRECVLASYQTDDMEWKKAAEMPSEEIYSRMDGVSLGSYNGRLYLIGGYQIATKEASDQVRSIDPAAKEPAWRTEISLPEGRFRAQVRQSGTNLFVVLGGNTQGTVPRTLIYNGKNWQMVEQELSPVETGKRYYQAQPGLQKGGLIFAGMTCSGLGSVFSLVKQNGQWQYVPTGYEFGGQDDTCAGASAGTEFYILQPDSTGFARLYGMTISSANVIVKDKSGKKYAVMEGAGEYLPGQTITVRAYATSGKYFIKYFTCGGKKYAAKKKLTLTATKNLTVKAKHGYYVTKIKVRKKWKLKQGKKYRLKVKIQPKKASHKVKWTSSNRRFVSVNQKGVLNVKCGGKKVVITVKAKDGSGKKARCIVRTV